MRIVEGPHFDNVFTAKNKEKAIEIAKKIFLVALGTYAAAPIFLSARNAGGYVLGMECLNGTNFYSNYLPWLALTGSFLCNATTYIYANHKNDYEELCKTKKLELLLSFLGSIPCVTIALVDPDLSQSAFGISLIPTALLVLTFFNLKGIRSIKNRYVSYCTQQTSNTPDPESQQLVDPTAENPPNFTAFSLFLCLITGTALRGYATMAGVGAVAIGTGLEAAKNVDVYWTAPLGYFLSSIFLMSIFEYSSATIKKIKEIAKDPKRRNILYYSLYALTVALTYFSMGLAEKANAQTLPFPTEAGSIFSAAITLLYTEIFNVTGLVPLVDRFAPTFEKLWYPLLGAVSVAGIFITAGQNSNAVFLTNPGFWAALISSFICNATVNATFANEHYSHTTENVKNSNWKTWIKFFFLALPLLIIGSMPYTSFTFTNPKIMETPYGLGWLMLCFNSIANIALAKKGENLITNFVTKKFPNFVIRCCSPKDSNIHKRYDKQKNKENLLEQAKEYRLQTLQNMRAQNGDSDYKPLNDTPADSSIPKNTNELVTLLLQQPAAYNVSYKHTIGKRILGFAVFVSSAIALRGYWWITGIGFLKFLNLLNANLDETNNSNILKASTSFSVFFLTILKACRSSAELVYDTARIGGHKHPLFQALNTKQKTLFCTYIAACITMAWFSMGGAAMANEMCDEALFGKLSPALWASSQFFTMIITIFFNTLGLLEYAVKKMQDVTQENSIAQQIQQLDNVITGLENTDASDSTFTPTPLSRC